MTGTTSRTISLNGGLQFTVLKDTALVSALRDRLSADHLQQFAALVRRRADTGRLSAAGRVGPLGPASGDTQLAVAILIDEILLAVVIAPRLVRRRDEASDQALWVGELDDATKYELLDQIVG